MEVGTIRNLRYRERPANEGGRGGGRDTEWTGHEETSLLTSSSDNLMQTSVNS